MKPTYRILGQVKEYYPIIFIYSVCISVLTLATPISVQSLVSTFAFGPYLQPIFILSLLLLVVLTVLGLVKSLQYLMVEYLQRKLFTRATTTIGYSYVMSTEDTAEDTQEFDKKVDRFFDVVLLHKKLAFLVTDGFAIALQTFLGLILISLYHPFFIVLSALIVGSMILPIYFLGGRALKSAVIESTSKYDVAEHLRMLSINEIEKGDINQARKDIDNELSKFLENRSHHFRTLFIQNIIYAVMYALLNAFLLAMGGYLVVSSQLSLGQLVAAEIVVNTILLQFLYAQKYLEDFYDMYAAAVKVSIFYEKIERYQNLDDLKEKKNFFNSMRSLKSIYSPKNYRRIVAQFLVASFLLFTALLLTPWQQFSKGSGSVLALNPNDRIQQLTAPFPGIVEEWLVQDGQVVKKGDPIVRVVDNDPDFLLRLKMKRDSASAKFEAAREASRTSELNYSRQKQLMAEGLSSRKEFENAKITLQKLKAEEASAAAALTKTEVDLSRQQQQEITAPRDGQILRILLGSGKTNVKAGDRLVEFVPETKENAVELILDANDRPLIYAGRKVRLQFEGWPAIQFSGWPSVAIGSFGGIVSVIDPSVSAKGNFRVIVKPDPEDPNPWPDQKILRQGTRTLGLVILDQVSLGYELWRQINGFPKSMPHAPYGTNQKGSKQ